MFRYLAVLVLTLTFFSISWAEEAKYVLTIENNKFHPAELHVPANQRVKLEIENRDATPEEFESYELNREKLIAPRSKATVYVGPLAPGRYPFFGDFHPKTTTGVLVAE